MESVRLLKESIRIYRQGSSFLLKHSKWYKCADFQLYLIQTQSKKKILQQQQKLYNLQVPQMFCKFELHDIVSYGIYIYPQRMQAFTI